MRTIAAFFTLIMLVYLPGTATAVAESLTWAGCGITKKAFMAELATGFEKETGVKIDRKEEDRRVGEMVERDMQARWSRANSRCKGLKGRDRAACNHELNAEKREWMAMKKAAKSQHSPEWTDHNDHDPGQKANPGRGKGKGKGKNKKKDSGNN